MPLRQSIFAPGNYYHIFNRGINQEKIFFSKDNYLYCLRLLKLRSKSYLITVIAYCLMPNHYHLLLRQDSNISISKYINVVFSAYVQALNKRLGRKGPLFESRFKHVHVDKDEYVLHLCRYIHLNPVKAGLVSSPREWTFSNYLEWIGKRHGTLKDVDFISSYFKRLEDYERFVMDYQEEEDSSIRLEPYLFD